MGLVLERINAEGLAQLSYIVGDRSAGVAAVIDPRRDVDIYLTQARELGLRLTHIIETHIHADFVSGAHELQARLDIPIYGGHSDDYQFNYTPLTEGDTIQLGNITLAALHTPGHTPEHISLLVADAQQGSQPFGIFTGDFVFNLDVGRPDLLGKDVEKQLAADLYHSIFEKFLPLGDRLEVYPCHGAGSACGKSIGDRIQSTIGNERVFSEAMQERSQEAFIQWLLEDMPEPPSHYARLKQVNAHGAPVRGCWQTPRPLTAEQFNQHMSAPDAIVVDTRSMLAFGGGHLPGAINIGLGASFPSWAGRMIDPSQKVLLVVEDDQALQQAAENLFRIGIDRVAGYLQGGMQSWYLQGYPMQRVLELTADEVNQIKERQDVTVLDVRSDQEFLQGAIPGAVHIDLPHLEDNLNRLSPADDIVTYCGSGYRASIAASLLQKHGFSQVTNIPGSWGAWNAADLPVAAPA